MRSMPSPMKLQASEQVDYHAAFVPLAAPLMFVSPGLSVGEAQIALLGAD